jgi:hypothetical protein
MSSTPLDAKTDVQALELQINDISLTLPESLNKCKFLINNDVIDRNVGGKLDGAIDKPIDNSNQFKSSFLGHIARLQTSAAAGAGAGAGAGAVWKEATNNPEINLFLKDAAGTNDRNFVVSIQVVLIDAAKASVDASTDYAVNEVAIIQFPLYRSKPAPAEAYGGRRRTKAIKDKSAYRTRKHKK